MPTAVLFSAGLDSAVLAAAEARRDIVHAVYVSCGLAWEAEELAAVDRLRRPRPPDLHRPRPLSADALGTDRETAGLDTGRRCSSDGRNVMSERGVIYRPERHSSIALATLSNNPFPTRLDFAAIGTRCRSA
jgi:hypothetical protein